MLKTPPDVLVDAIVGDFPEPSVPDTPVYDPAELLPVSVVLPGKSLLPSLDVVVGTENVPELDDDAVPAGGYTFKVPR